MKNSKGFIVPLFLVVIAVLAVSGGAYYYKKSQESAHQAVTSNDNFLQNSNQKEANQPLSLIVLSPNGGESWKVGTTQTIRWNPGALKIEHVGISIFDYTLPVHQYSIVGTIANSGSYSWTIPSTINGVPLNGSNYKIEISDGAVTSDQSDASFTITTQATTKKKSELNTNLITAEQLKQRDVDNDGLSDYDELTKYHTLFFKSDTDEDGISDGDEVRRGSDPKDNIKNIDNSKRPLPDFGDLSVKIISKQCENNLTPGDVVQAQGKGFKENVEVIVRMSTGAPSYYYVGITKANKDGNIDFTFTIPIDFTPTATGLEVLGNGAQGQAHLLIGDPMYIANTCLYKDKSVENARVNPLSELDSLPFSIYLPSPEQYAHVSAYRVQGVATAPNPSDRYIGVFIEKAESLTLNMFETLKSSVYKPEVDCRSSYEVSIYDFNLKDINNSYSNINDAKSQQQKQSSIEHLNQTYGPQPCTLAGAASSGRKIYTRSIRENTLTLRFYYFWIDNTLMRFELDDSRTYNDRHPYEFSNGELERLVDSFQKTTTAELTKYEQNP